MLAHISSKLYSQFKKKDTQDYLYSPVINEKKTFSKQENANEKKQKVTEIALSNIELLRANFMPLNKINSFRNRYFLQIWFSEKGNIKILKGSMHVSNWTSSESKPENFETFNTQKICEMFGDFHVQLTCLFYEPNILYRIEWEMNQKEQFKPIVRKVISVTKKLFLSSYYKINHYIGSLAPENEFFKFLKKKNIYFNQSSLKISPKEIYNFYITFHKFTFADCLFFLPNIGLKLKINTILNMK